MAKVVGLVGSASGKIGNIVYAVTNGIQVARVYQPVVSNPKSNLQLIQRAKGNLAGRISSFCPKTAIMGLGKNSRQRRAEFLRVLLKAAQVTSVAGNYLAKVDDESVIFSKGSVILSVHQPTLTAGVNTLDVSLNGINTTVIPADVYESMHTRVVVMVYDYTSQDLVLVSTRVINKPQQGSSSLTSIPIDKQNGYIAVAYLIPFSTADGSAISIDTSLAVKDDDDIAATLSANRNAVIFNYGRSVLIGSATYNPGA